MKAFLTLFFSLSLLILSAQTDDDYDFKNEISDESIVNLQDTIILADAEFYSVQLNSDLEKKYYVWLRKRVRDVWPFVNVAVTEYNQIQDSIELVSSKREKKKLIKERQKKLATEFEDKLKKLSISRGQILTKLLYKETGKTAYEIIKELKGGFNAFVWNSTGGAFDIDLKQTFDPKNTREDLYIQVILQKDFASGVLEPIFYTPKKEIKK